MTFEQICQWASGGLWYVDYGVDTRDRYVLAQHPDGQKPYLVADCYADSYDDCQVPENYQANAHMIVELRHFVEELAKMYAEGDRRQLGDKTIEAYEMRSDDVVKLAGLIRRARQMTRCKPASLVED